MAVILNGKALSEKIISLCGQLVATMESKPQLAVIQIGEDPASTIYVNKKHRIAEEIGINSVIIRLPATVTEEKLLTIIDELNKDKTTTAILVQLPLLNHINANNIIEAIDYRKDVDGFSAYNSAAISQGRVPLSFPCTPLGILCLLKEYNINVKGRHAVIIGRSNIVGRPLASMLLNLDATVTVCHSKTRNLAEITKTADILVSAVGKAGFVTADMVKPGACVVDVGINRDDNGKIVGDVDFENVKNIASFITPTPGGVGPMTIAMLMRNTVELFEKNN